MKITVLGCGRWGSFIAWYLDNREWWETIISGEYQNYYENMYKGV